MASFHDRSYLDEMTRSGRSQAAFEGSQNSPSPTGRRTHVVPTRPSWEHDQRAQLGRLEDPSQTDLSSLHYYSHLDEMDQSGRPQAAPRGWRNSISFTGQRTDIPPPRYSPEPDTAERGRIEMHLPSTFRYRSHPDEMIQSGRPQAAFGGSQNSLSFPGRHMDMAPTQARINADLAWGGSSEEAVRDSRNSSSPAGPHMDMSLTQSRMNLFDEISRKGSSEAAVRGSQNPSSPVRRRLPAPPGTPNTNHEIRRFSASAALQTEVGGDFICLCTPEPPRPRNSFMLYRQHYQRAVAKAHKGLSNPDISKIIGLMWREAAEDVRERWAQRAEEEKRRHGVKYPGYRYKPNRRPKSQGKQNRRCSRCGGRLNATARSPGSPGSPGSSGSSQCSPVSRTPREPRTSQASRAPRTPRTSRTSPTPLTPFATSSSTLFATPVLATGHGKSEPSPRPPLSISNPAVRRPTGIEPSPLHKIAKQGEPRSPEDYGPASPDRRRRRTNDAGDYCSTSSRRSDFDSGRRPEPTGPAFDGRLATAVLPEPASLPRSHSLSTLPPLPRQQGTDPRRSSLFGDPPRLPTLEPPLPQTPSWPYLADYSIHRRLEDEP